MAKQFFAEHGIVYEERDVIADEAARDEMVRKSGQMGVPVIDIDGKIVVGFDRDRLVELLKVGDRG
jgi:glutaredoxin